MTKRPVLLDTGPLVSYLVPELQHHSWATVEWERVRPPLLTCEAVLTEAAFLLRREGRDADVLFGLLDRGVFQIAIHVQGEQASLRALMRSYRNRPMSLADACMVRLAELHPDGEVFTTDSDFRIYRRYGNKVIPVRMPG